MTDATRAARGPYVEVTGPPFTPLEPGEHLLQPVIARAAQDPTRVVAAHRVGDGYVDVTAAELLDRVRALAKGLIASGVEPGERVVLMSHTRLDWVLLDLAILAAGCVTVPVYETSSSEQLNWIVVDSGAVVVFVETPEMLTMLDAGPASASDAALVIDGGAIDEMVTRGRATGDGALDARIAAISTDDIATIIYTSGTTGRPKGCVLTHGNLRSNVKQNLDAVGEMFGPDESSLLFLPLAHSLAKIIALVGAEHGVKAVFATDMAHLGEELPIVGPTMVVGVPRIFEKVFNAAQRRSIAKHMGPIFDRACDVATRFSKQRMAGDPTWPTRIEHAVFDRLVYAKVRAAFGGSLRLAMSGGSALGERLTYFFDGAGVRIFEGYGLTETSPTVTVNSARAWRPGTVGRPVAGTSLRLDDDGEILVKGPQVFGGYWRNDEATAEAFTADGWFRTGDIGELDDGFLRITGRKKELIVTAGGKNVAPAPLEDRLRSHPLISQVLVVGNSRPFIAALVTIDEEAFAIWRAEHHDEVKAIPEWARDPRLRAEVQAAVDEVNESVSRPESIRAFAILPTDFTVESGEITPTMKVRRTIVEQRYQTIVEQLYGN